MAIAAAKCFVAIDEGLHAVGTARQADDRAERISERGRIYGLSLARLPSLDVDAEYLLSARCVADLKARFARCVGGDEHEQAAIQRCATAFSEESDFESKAGPAGLRVSARREGRRSEQRREEEKCYARDATTNQVAPLPSTLAIAVMVFQLRVVTGTPKSPSNVPR